MRTVTLPLTRYPLGDTIVFAQSQVTQDSGSAPVEVTFAGETSYVSITLTGLGRITGTAENYDGSAAGM